MLTTLYIPGAILVSKQDEENNSLPYIFAIFGPPRWCVLMIFMSVDTRTATGLST